MPDSRWREIDARTFSFEEEGVRFFLLLGSTQALLIDSGMHLNDARERAGELTKLPLSLLNTHGDIDHVGSNAEFEQIYVSPHELIHPQLRNRRSHQIIPLWDGDTLDLGNRVLEIIALPGHTPGSVAVLDRDTGWLFSGDPIQRNGSIYLFGPLRSLAAYLHSLRRLATKTASLSALYPSHASCPVDVSTIFELIRGAEAIERGEAPFTMREMHGTPVRAYDVGVATLLLDA